MRKVISVHGLLRQLQEAHGLLALEKVKSTNLEGELSKIKKEAYEESQQYEKTKDELLRQQKLLSEVSYRHQQLDCYLQPVFAELNRTTSLLQEITKCLLEKLTSQRSELPELQKLHDEILYQIKTFKIRQNNIVKHFVKFREWIEIQVCNGYGMANFTEFSHVELKEATNDFNDEHKIGKGGYGTVYKGILQCTTVAIKVLNKGSEQGEREFIQEVETLQKVRHPNLVKLIGACRENWTIVYEFLPEGSLEDSLANAEARKSLSWEKRIQIASTICSALIYLHQTKPHGIVHGDLKPANIILDSTYTCKLIDFGLCRQLKLTDATRTPHHTTKAPGGTFCYFDPEFQETAKLTTKSDVFAFGVVLLQLVTGTGPIAIRMLVQNAIKRGKLNEVVDASANWPLDVAEKMALLGLHCITRLGKKRPHLEDIWIEIESMEQVASEEENDDNYQEEGDAVDVYDSDSDESESDTDEGAENVVEERLPVKKRLSYSGKQLRKPTKTKNKNNKEKKKDLSELEEIEEENYEEEETEELVRPIRSIAVQAEREAIHPIQSDSDSDVSQTDSHANVKQTFAYRLAHSIFGFRSDSADGS